MSSQVNNQPAFLNPTYSFVIPAASDTSQLVDLGAQSLSAVHFPSGMTGTTLTFLGSLDGVNVYPLHNTLNQPIQFSFTPDTIVSLVPSDFAGTRYVAVKSSAIEGSGATIHSAGRIYK